MKLAHCELSTRIAASVATKSDQRELPPGIDEFMAPLDDETRAGGFFSAAALLRMPDDPHLRRAVRPAANGARASPAAA